MKWHSVLVIVLVLILNSCQKTNVELPIVEVYGHAGTSLHKDRAIYPANSFESIQYGLDILDAEGVEVDVQMTKDSVLVLFHNSFLEVSTNFYGCISEYNFEELKSLKLDHTNYHIVDLETVLKLVESRQKKIYLDIKTYNYCLLESINIATFQYAFNNSISNLSTSFIEDITIGIASNTILNQINHTNKCLETASVTQGINIAQNNNIQSILIRLSNLSVNDAKLLNDSNLNWGILNIKDEWTVDEAVALHPKFVITDNIAYTNKVTN